MSTPVPPSDLGPPGGRRTVWVALLALMLVVIAGFGIVERDRLAADAPAGAASPGEPIRAAQAEGTSLMGVGRLEGLPRACTAWLLDVGAVPQATAHAVTAGRCLGIEDTATVLAREPVTGASVVLGAFAAATPVSRTEPIRVPVDRVVWASMRGTDLALLRLATTYGDLAARGVRPIPAAEPLGAGAQILVAGVPIGGIPGPERNLRGSRCSVGGTVDVLEAPWVWPAVQSSDCAGFLEGSAGSPALDPGGRAVGMAVTTTIGSERADRCYEGRPCEVRSEDVRVAADTTYLTSVAGLDQCFAEGAFGDGEQCPLEDPAGVVEAVPQSPDARPGGAVRITVEGRRPNSPVGSRIGPLGDVDCFDAAGWRTSVLTGDVLTVQMPVIQGFALACVGTPSQPTPIVVEADSAAPDASDVGLDQWEVPGGVLVRPTSDSADVTGFRWTAGPTGSITCATAEGWAEYRGQPELIEVADLPMTVCVVGLDEAGNATAPVAVEVTLPGE